MTYLIKKEKNSFFNGEEKPHYWQWGITSIIITLTLGLIGGLILGVMKIFDGGKWMKRELAIILLTTVITTLCRISFAFTQAFPGC